MNYFIQGDAANADKIKAAFEKLGYEKVNVIHIGDYANERLFFFTENGKVRSTLKDCGIANIIKTHPDYKELELPVKPNFKVGDWLVYNDGNTFCLGKKEVQIQAVEKDSYIFTQDGSGFHKFIDDHCRLWTISDAKDGDILSAKIDGDDYILIFKQIKDGWVETYGHYYITIDKFCAPTQMFCRNYQGRLYPATQEQYRTLFKKMHDDGYEWDVDKKELRKIKSHYNIANFKPRQWVLVRDCDNQVWGLSMFSHRDMGCYICLNREDFTQCIPFEGNERLLGTTDMPSEEYINW